MKADTIGAMPAIGFSLRNFVDVARFIVASKCINQCALQMDVVIAVKNFTNRNSKKGSAIANTPSIPYLKVQGFQERFFLKPFRFSSNFN